MSNFETIPLPFSRLAPDPSRGQGLAPVVLIHGFAGSRRVWQFVDRKIGAVREVLAFDLPGHGFALHWPGEVHPMNSALALVASLDALGIRRCHLVGHSMGGAIAALAALRRPELAASLTLVSPGGFGPQIDGDMLERFAKAVSESDLEQAMGGFFGPNNPIPRRFLREAALERRRVGVTAANLRLLSRIVREGRQGEVDKAAIAALNCPVKVIWGEEDRILPVHQASDLPGIVARHIFAGVGHMPLLEVPDEVARLILQNAAVE